MSLASHERGDADAIGRRDLAFKFAAAFAAVVTVYHLTALILPSFASIAYPPTYPVWRHLAFILIGAALVPLCLRRPMWLIWPYSVLALQVLSGHGVRVWRSLRGTAAIDWVSVVVVAAVSLTFVLLAVDWRERRRSGSP